MKNSTKTVKTQHATYTYRPGAGGGINQNMSKERRAKKQTRYKANEAVRFQRSTGKG